MNKLIKFTGAILLSIMLLSSCNNYDIEKDAATYGKVRCELKYTSTKSPNYKILKAKKDSIYKVVKERYYDDRDDKLKFKGILLNIKMKCIKKHNHYSR